MEVYTFHHSILGVIEISTFKVRRFCDRGTDVSISRFLNLSFTCAAPREFATLMIKPYPFLGRFFIRGLKTRSLLSDSVKRII